MSTIPPDNSRYSLTRNPLMATITMMAFLGFVLLFSPQSTAENQGVTTGQADAPSASPSPVTVLTQTEDVQTFDSEWLVKWMAGADPEQLLQEMSHDFENVSLLKMDSANRTLVIHIPLEELEAFKKGNGTEPSWSGSVEYIQPNYRYRMFAAETKEKLPDDTMFNKQYHLQMIRATQGWAYVRENRDITIALLDTGVDTSHPDLKDNLIQGENILEPESPPIDDNGHGTKVAGILGAVGNNKEGVSGVVWRTRMMPFKILDKNGVSDDFTVGKGIRRAVDRGAKILLLPLGLPQYSQHLKEAIDYAKSKNVLVVAATGNEGSRVNYPASFPYVLAVGAVNQQQKPLAYANVGPEMDVVAPGIRILTTAPGGGYTEVEGTSMAAPQVAGLAALVWKQHPQWTPEQVKSHIRSTARDLDKPGWDLKTGHGLIDLEKALGTANPIYDAFEPNNIRGKAATISIEGEWNAQLTPDDRIDWYRLDSPYPGRVTMQVKFEKKPEREVMVTHIHAGGDVIQSYRLQQSQAITLTVPEGTTFVRWEIVAVSADGNADDDRNWSPIRYHVSNQFAIAADRYEENDTRDKAYPLFRNSSIRGTFHKVNDHDWYVLHIPTAGKLDIEISVDTVRMDPVLVIEKPNESTAQMVDDGNIHNGQGEHVSIEVVPGKYYLLIHDYEGNPVNGEYEMKLTYLAEQPDFNEPNNTLEQATPIALEKPVYGTLPVLSDFDWFRFEVKEKGAVRLSLSEIPPDTKLRMAWYDDQRKTIEYRQLGANETDWQVIRNVDAGTYYLRLDALQKLRFQRYQLLVQWDQPQLYKDTWRHWASDSINKLSENGVIKGYEDGTFRPERAVTRAEFVAQIMRVVKDKEKVLPAAAVREQRKQIFDELKDTRADHWAYQDLLLAYQYGWIFGYPDQAIRPDQTVTRAEATVIINRVIRQLPSFSQPQAKDVPVYTDVPKESWMYAEVQNMRARGYLGDYLSGADRNQFLPDKKLTRAELAVMLDKVFFSR